MSREALTAAVIRGEAGRQEKCRGGCGELILRGDVIYAVRKRRHKSGSPYHPYTCEACAWDRIIRTRP